MRTPETRMEANVDDVLIRSAITVLRACGYDFFWMPGRMSTKASRSYITHFLTRRSWRAGPPGRAEWDVWDATMGKPDLAFVVMTVLGLEEDTT